ncbi:Zinc finger MYND domain-containing protein 10 [Araneus ventricosus]|uniref:Zinc finger MYND domain-containing protein 10 n=1 Tax=Araneus ventricosus TaxID=182803 RepID=A0A4Y2SKL2_ARAVE|nr:Zinc finger MYND domain-containing protein 10 [Araneus ventricosus]
MNRPIASKRTKQSNRNETQYSLLLKTPMKRSISAHARMLLDKNIIAQPKQMFSHLRSWRQRVGDPNRSQIPVLIYELIATEIWRLKIFPLLLKMEHPSKSVIPIYLVLYHEVALETFLEAVLFHEDAMEAAGDSLIDLVDYCYRNIVLFTR